MLLQHVAAEILPDRPIEDHLGGVREVSLAVRVYAGGLLLPPKLYAFLDFAAPRLNVGLSQAAA
jgi:hypothetical protein